MKTKYYYLDILLAIAAFAVLVIVMYEAGKWANWFWHSWRPGF